MYIQSIFPLVTYLRSLKFKLYAGIILPLNISPLNIFEQSSPFYRQKTMCTSRYIHVNLSSAFDIYILYVSIQVATYLPNICINHDPYTMKHVAKIMLESQRVCNHVDMWQISAGIFKDTMALCQYFHT